jgi:hypothetical protein
MVSLSPLFSQTGFEDQVLRAAEELNGTLAFTSGMGLNWSDPYVGELLGFPAHIGVGVAMTGTFMDNVSTANLWADMGRNIDSSIWYPSYAITTRIGGPKGVPFDLGFKIGYLPDIPLWTDLQYNMLLYGIDVNYALFVLDNTDTTITIGVGFDYFEGAVSGTLATVPTGIAVPLGTPAHLTWESSTYKIKALIGQPILASPVSVFGGVQAGYSANTIGVKFGDVKTPDSEVTQDLTLISFFGHFGLGLQLYEWNFDASVMINFAATFDLGFSIGFRYQP